jgi:hypothetical protein
MIFTAILNRIEAAELLVINYQGKLNGRVKVKGKLTMHVT